MTTQPRPLLNRVPTEPEIEASAAEDRSYHDSKATHYYALAQAARLEGAIAEVVALERMADRHRILARG